MIHRGDADCRRVERSLTALASGLEPIHDRRLVVSHLERCDACLGALEDLTLTVYALRRLGALPEVASQSAAAWPRLRERILRSRASAAALAWRWRTTLAGMAAGALVVAAVTAPLALHLPLGATGGEPVGYSVELDGLGDLGLIDPAARSAALITTSNLSVSLDGLPKRYPDGAAPAAKEVQSRAIGRPPTVD